MILDNTPVEPPGFLPALAADEHRRSSIRCVSL